MDSEIKVVKNITEAMQVVIVKVVGECRQYYKNAPYKILKNINKIKSINKIFDEIEIIKNKTSSISISREHKKHILNELVGKRGYMVLKETKKKKVIAIPTLEGEKYADDNFAKCAELITGFNFRRF